MGSVRKELVWTIFSSCLALGYDASFSNQLITKKLHLLSAMTLKLMIFDASDVAQKTKMLFFF